MSSTTYASNPEELLAAVSTAKEGTTIVLEGGNYGTMQMRAGSNVPQLIPSGVTIRSADIDNPAVFNGLDVVGVSNLTFDGLRFDYEFKQGDNTWTSPFGFYDSSDIAVLNSIYDGDLAQGISPEEDGHGFGTGLIVRGSENIVFENNEMFNFWKGVKIGTSNDIVLRGNDIHSLRMDGINFAEVQSLLIEDNHIHDFDRTTLRWDHADMIQGWTAGTDAPTSDVTIRNNLLDIGEGDPSHSIFMGNNLVDTGQAGVDMYWRNVTVENNLIVNGHSHGIAIGAGVGINVSGNTVVHSDGANVDGKDRAVEIPRISISSLSQDVVIQDNITADILGDGDAADWTVSDNLLVQDQDTTGDNHYRDVFIGSTIDDRSFHAEPDVSDGAGANLSAPSGLLVRFHSSIVPENSAAMSFDARHSVLDGNELPVGTEFIWAFGDGRTATGATVDHVFPDAGSYEVALTVRLPDGTSGQAEQDLLIEGPELAVYSTGSPAEINSGGLMTALDETKSWADGGLMLDVHGAALTIPRSVLSRLLDSEEFTISLEATLSAAASAGSLFRMGHDLNAWVSDSGDIIVKATSEKGKVVLKTSGAQLNDASSHAINLILSDGKLNLLIDGNVVDSDAFSGTLDGKSQHDFTFGSPWSNNAVGIVEGFSLSLSTGDLASADLPSEFADESAEQPDVDVDPQLPVSDNTHSQPPFSDQPVSQSPIPDGQDPQSPPLKEPKWSPLVKFDTETGFVAYSAATHLEEVNFTEELGFEIAEEGTSNPFPRAYLDELINANGFQISLSIQSQDEDGSGHLMHLGGRFSAYVASDGDVVIRTHNADGQINKHASDGVNVSDGSLHELEVIYHDEFLFVEIDEVRVIEVAMETPMAAGNSSGWFFGNPWDLNNFEARVDGLEVSALLQDADEGAYESSLQDLGDSFVLT